MHLDELRVDSDRRQAMAVVAIWVITGLWYLRTDFALYAGNWERLSERLVVRALMVAVSFAVIALLRTTSTSEAYSRVVFGFALATAVFIVAINVLRPRGGTLPLDTVLQHLHAVRPLPDRFCQVIRRSS